MAFKNKKENITDDDLNFNINVVKPPKNILKLSFWLVVIGVGVFLALLLPGVDDGKIFIFTLTGLTCIVIAAFCLLLYINYKIEYDVDGFTYRNIIGKTCKYYYDDITYVNTRVFNGDVTVSICLNNGKKISFPPTYVGAKEFYEYLKIKNKI